MKWTLLVKDDDESANLLHILIQQPDSALKQVLKEVKIVRFGETPYIESKKKKIVGVKKVLPVLVQRKQLTRPQSKPSSGAEFDYNAMIQNEMYDELQEESDVDEKKQDKELIAKRVEEIQNSRNSVRPPARVATDHHDSQFNHHDSIKNEQINTTVEDDMDEYFKTMMGKG